MFFMRISKKVKKILAVLGLSMISVMAVPTVSHAGLLVDSAGKNAIDSAQADIKEIGGATILVGCMIWGIRRTRSL